MAPAFGRNALSDISKQFDWGTVRRLAGSLKLSPYGRQSYAATNSILSISVGSSGSAFELLTRFDTGQRCR